MPTYSYRCNKCDTYFDRILKIAEMDLPLTKECDNCKSINTIERVMLAAPNMGDPVRLGFTRPDGGIKEVLAKIHEKTAGSKINDSSNLTRM